MHASPLVALVCLHSEHAHVLSKAEATQPISVCCAASLWPEICGRWGDRALELPRGKSTAPCHLSSPWHCACWNQATSSLQMRQYIRCWINEWWNLDRLKWKKKKVSEAICPTRLDCHGSTDGEWKSGEGREASLSDTQLEILILILEEIWIMIACTLWHVHWRQESFGHFLTLFITNCVELETKYQTKWYFLRTNITFLNHFGNDFQLLSRWILMDIQSQSSQVLTSMLAE